nr:hypothetical protein BHI3_17120 [Bacteriovorax sp. HI3]
MKIMTLLFIGLFSASAFSSTFMCRSYKTGALIIADTERREIIVKDRFGNELNILDEVDSTAVDSTLIFTLEGEVVFSVESYEDGKLLGTFENDSSYQCFVRN